MLELDILEIDSQGVGCEEACAGTTIRVFALYMGELVLEVSLHVILFIDVLGLESSPSTSSCVTALGMSWSTR